MARQGLVEKLQNGGNVVIAEGYLWEFERRGYAKYGAYTPEVVLDHPEGVRHLHEEFVHAGSDVVEAYTYYGHRQKLKQIGREDQLETLNMTALKLAREVADTTNTLMAGSLSNTNIFDPQDPTTFDIVSLMFKEQVEWAVKGGADYIICETVSDYKEAELALEAIQKYGNGLPAVITMTAYGPDRTLDEVPFPEALRKLEDLGAAVVGLNCGRGPATMLPLLKLIRQSCKGPIAALPVPFRTNNQQKTWNSLKDSTTGKAIYPQDVCTAYCTREEIRDFATAAKELGVQYIGLCCGNSSSLFREVAQVYGRTPAASQYNSDLGFSYVLGGNITTHAKKTLQFMNCEIE